MRGETEADLIGQAEIPEKLIGQAEATTGVFDCQVVVETPSEEVVTHHLDELWYLGPGEKIETVSEGGKVTHNTDTEKKKRKSPESLRWGRAQRGRSFRGVQSRNIDDSLHGEIFTSSLTIREKHAIF